MKYFFEDCGMTLEIQCKKKSELYWRIPNALIRKYSLQEVTNKLNIHGFLIEKCKICSNPLKFYFELNENLKIVRITSEKKYNGYQYCYGYNKKCNGIKMNSNSAEFISLVKDISLDDAKEYIRKNNKSPFYKENHINEESYNKFQSRNKEFFIKKYGELEGLLKYIESTKKANFSRSLEGYIQKYGKIDGSYRWKKYNESKDSMSRKNFSNEEDYQNRLNKVKHTKENFILRHGDIDGAKKWNLYLEEKSKRQFKIGGYSKWQISLIEKIIQLKEFKNLNVYKKHYATLDKEFYLEKPGDNPQNFFYDFTFFSDNCKAIIEFNGSLFHPSPKISDDKKKTWTKLFSNIDYNTALEYDKIKKDTAISHGFKYLEIWDDNDETSNIEIIKFFLNECN